MAKKTRKPKKTISVLESNPDAEIAEVKSEPVQVRVRSLIPFYDLEAKIERGAGAEWEVSTDRAELLRKLGIAIVL